MAQLDGWNKLKFNNDGEYYELLGFLSKDDTVFILETIENDRSGARAPQNIFRLKKGYSVDGLPKVLKEAYESGNDPIRLSETKYIGNLIENHSFSEKTTSGENDYITHWYKSSLDDVMGTVPAEYREDFYRGYEWNFQLMEQIRRHSKDEYNVENKTVLKSTKATGHLEGKKKQCYTTLYERDKTNRKEAIRIHGAKCMICGFDYEAVYGELGRGYIEVHHIKPLSSLDEEVKVNPKTDLVCVCANCHRMLHRFSDYIISVEELKKIVGNGVKNNG